MFGFFVPLMCVECECEVCFAFFFFFFFCLKMPVFDQ